MDAVNNLGRKLTIIIVTLLSTRKKLIVYN